MKFLVITNETVLSHDTDISMDVLQTHINDEPVEVYETGNKRVVIFTAANAHTLPLNTRAHQVCSDLALKPESPLRGPVLICGKNKSDYMDDLPLNMWQQFTQ